MQGSALFLTNPAGPGADANAAISFDTVLYQP